MSELQLSESLVLTAGQKRAAMKLCGVSEADRQWIFSRLPPAQREAVKLAIHQLQTIQGNISLDFSSFFDATGATEADINQHLSEFSINKLSYESVKLVLDELSSAYVVSFLRTEIWQDRSKYWSDCTPARRNQLEGLDSRPLTTRSARSLTEAVASLVEKQSGAYDG